MGNSRAFCFWESSDALRKSGIALTFETYTSLGIWALCVCACECMWLLVFVSCLCYWRWFFVDSSCLFLFSLNRSFSVFCWTFCLKIQWTKQNMARIRSRHVYSVPRLYIFRCLKKSISLPSGDSHVRVCLYACDIIFICFISQRLFTKPCFNFSNNCMQFYTLLSALPNSFSFL